MTGYGGRGEYFEWKKIQGGIAGNGEWVFQTEIKVEGKGERNSMPRLQVEGGRKTLEKENKIGLGRARWFLPVVEPRGDGRRGGGAEGRNVNKNTRDQSRR